MKTVVTWIHVQAGKDGDAIFGFPERMPLPRTASENHFELTTYDYLNALQSTSEGSFRMFSHRPEGKFFPNTSVEGKSMPGERDIRLIGLLRATLGFVDGLRDIGVEGEIAVRLDRAGARRLLDVVDARGGYSVRLAGLTFEWPRHEPLEALAANDNAGVPALEDETPASR
jgi:hypothetical protein